MIFHLNAEFMILFMKHEKLGLRFQAVYFIHQINSMNEICDQSSMANFIIKCLFNVFVKVQKRIHTYSPLQHAIE